ncbi:hypothetical protein FN846DRAFT_806204 [Sphaerosporella brunnea]|uniref:non-specific serine/threonine protein kinase n=1 Tax=Sphaerosporella brunnea TaxID=1250544 RepID=A0A5J5FBD3_9PEZI|nr:hypothetical protein FN846DRAFT_806204 [Sphaerosporella brunnea]
MDCPRTSLDLDAALNRVEDVAMYAPGGYHPLEIGDELHNGRYRIIHRLGSCGYSTVWLALNQRFGTAAQPDAPRSRYVAVKVAILHQLQQQPDLDSWWDSCTSGTKPKECPFIISVLDELKIKGTNGTHPCIVTELVGPSVAAVKGCSDIIDSAILPVNMGRRLAMQAAKAVAFLHSHGIVPAAVDFHTGNLEFTQSVDIHSWSVEEVYAALGGELITVPHSAALGRLDESTPQIESPHEPKYLVCPPSVSKFWPLCNSSTPNIRVLDFGESFCLPFKFSGQALPGTLPRSCFSTYPGTSPQGSIFGRRDAPSTSFLALAVYSLVCGAHLCITWLTLWRLGRRGSGMRSAKRARYLTLTKGDWVEMARWRFCAETPRIRMEMRPCCCPRRMRRC